MRATCVLALTFAWSLIAVVAMADDLTIDGTTQETFEASVREMTEGLSDQDAKAFAAGLMNMILTEYPPAKGQEGLSILFFAEEATKAAPRTLDGKTLAEILERGRGLGGSKVAPADDQAASDQERVRECLRQAVVVQNAEVTRGDFSPNLELTIANRLAWPIAGIRFHYEVRTEGRAVPWAEDDTALAIAGGIEPGEMRTIGTSLFSMPSEAREPFDVRVTISDVADQDKRQLIGDVRIIDWGQEPSARTCDVAGLAPAATLAPGPSDPVGEPLTDSEKDGFRLALQRCWNVPAGLRDARDLKATVGAELTADGSVINVSIRLIEPSPAPDGRFQQLFEATRRAIIRCAPFTDLPREKYALWRNIEVVANPEGIVSW